MKRKHAAILLSVALGMSVLSGCGGADKKAEATAISQEKDEDAVYGEVSKVTESAVTIKVGTRKQMEKSTEKETEGTDKSKDFSEEKPEKGEMPSMLELTGEEQEIQITDDTVLKRGGMGRMPQNGEASTGEKPEDGEAPSGEMPENGEAPSGERPENGEAPSGEKPENGERPERTEESQEISISDISEGDTIRVTFAEDGSAAEITVMSGMGGGGDQTSQQDSYAATVYQMTVWTEYQDKKLSHV